MFLFAVSEAAVCEEAEELEMQKEKYIQDLQQALTETESCVAYSFILTPSPPNHSAAVTLAYEKVQKDISVSVNTLNFKYCPCVLTRHSIPSSLISISTVFNEQVIDPSLIF